VMVMLVEAGVAPGWMVAAIVVREFLVSGLRLAALERGVVLHARDLGKLKTWSQAVAAAVGGFAAAGAWRDDVAWWALLVAVVMTWLSGLDYARVAPRLWRGEAPA
jgi:CDP-diacylglycerol---glycerol-3-phosphate 3-phosphatidyltransferase